MITKEYFEAWINIAGVITGLLLVFIFTPFYMNSGKAALLRCKILYPDENPIFFIKSSILQSIIITSLFGAFLGTFILPFFIFEGLHSIRQVSVSTLWIYCFAFLIGLYGIFFRFNITYVLTDRGIRIISPYRILRPMFKEDFFIKYDDIKSVQLNKSFFMSRLLIHLKNDEIFRGLVGFVHLEKAEKIITGYMNKGV